jgi:hypothetical protein
VVKADLKKGSHIRVRMSASSHSKGNDARFAIRLCSVVSRSSRNRLTVNQTGLVAVTLTQELRSFSWSVGDHAVVDSYK